MRIVRRTAVAAVCAVALVWSSASARAAGVLDQVPANAFVVVKVNNLEQTSKKVARWAEQLGLAQAVPEFADPLGALEKQLNLKQGLDRTGELAFVFVDPQTVGGKQDDAMLILAPTKDYNAFIKNLEGVKPAAGGGVSTFRPAQDDKDSFVAQWGNYAAMSPSQALLGKKPTAGAFKLSTLAAREGNERDVLVFANIPALRSQGLQALEQGRAQMLQEIDRAGKGGGANAPGAGPAAGNPQAQQMAQKFGPVFRALANQYLNGAKQFLQDSEGAMIALSVSDQGLNATIASDFKAGSYIGDAAAKTKNSNQNLMAGLPQRKYFAFGGMTVTPEVAKKLFADIADPIAKELNAVGPDGKALGDAVTAAKASAGSMESFAFGYTVPTGALGADSILQSVGVVKGDAKAIAAAQKQMLAGTGQLLGGLPAGGGGNMTFEQQPGGKTVGGVTLDTYSFNLQMDENNPQAAQAQQMMAFVYGPNGIGGTYGAVDPKTFVVVQGGTDKLIADTVASAKAGADPLSQLAAVQAVQKQLPSDRFFVEFVDLAQMVTSGVKYAQGFGLPVKMQLPQNLPPIGMSGSTQGPAVRFDVHVPTTLVQSLVAAGMQTYMQMQGGDGAGQPDGL